MIVRDFLPDYSTLLYTSQEAEHELKGFKFQGPGWYLTETGATLVAPKERSSGILRTPMSGALGRTPGGRARSSGSSSGVSGTLRTRSTRS